MASRQDRPPIWTQPEPGKRAPRLSREQIAAAALRVADGEGFAAVSMRRVAQELEAGTMSLYHYVRTKEDLVALMDDVLMASIVVDDATLPAGWRAGLTAIAMHTRAVFVAHPWALGALRGAGPGPNAMRHFEQCLSTLKDTRCTPAQKMVVLAAVDDFVFGNVQRSRDSVFARTDCAPDVEAARQATLAFAKEQLLSGAFPHMRSLLDDADDAAAFALLAEATSSAERFSTGLDCLLDGIAARFPMA
ncbi:MAG TPA: TetR/AcrR family transcriptional regulator C-terminal domain-containing protein [Myxococcota bacterium]